MVSFDAITLSPAGRDESRAELFADSENVNIHQGGEVDIGVVGAAGGGSIFWFTIPMRQLTDEMEPTTV